MIVQTIDHFCEDTENLDNFALGIEAIVDNVEDSYKRRDVRKKNRKQLVDSTFGTVSTCLSTFTATDDLKEKSTTSSASDSSIPSCQVGFRLKSSLCTILQDPFRSTIKVNQYLYSKVAPLDIP